MTLSRRAAPLSPSGEAGFTLLEMLVVLVLIGLLAGLVGPRLMGQVDKGSAAAAAAQVKILDNALQMMRLDLGRFPSPEEGLGLLVQAPADRALKARWKGPYLDGAVPADPWNNPYQYRVPGQNGRAYDVFSLGADGRPGGSDLDADIGIAVAR